MLRYLENTFFMAAILKSQDGRHLYIWLIGNIGFLIAYATQFPKIIYNTVTSGKLETLVF